MRWALLFPLVLAACGFGQRDDAQVNSRGSVCGHPEIKGEVIGAVDAEHPVCGIDNAVRITSVGGIALSQPSVVECGTALALNNWVKTDVDQILGIRGGGLEELKIAAHYACRTRNHQPGAKISEHGKGRAIDISAFNFRDGSSITLKDDWGSGRNGRLLRRLHESACGPFGTVLGPESDRWHQDHFHFDIAQHRGGPYCR